MKRVKKQRKDKESKEGKNETYKERNRQKGAKK